MNIIRNVIEDFFDCCNLPVLAVDLKFNNIGTVEYDNIYFDIINKNQLYKDIDLKNTSYIYLKYPDDINFVVTNISKFNKYRGYFIIGPFNTSNNSSLHFKPINCIPYLSNIIINISDSVFSNGMSNLTYSTYTRRAIAFVHTNYSKEVSIDAICGDLSINKSYFCKVFKKETGFTFSNFLNNYRIEKSKKYLLETNYTLLDISLLVGFNTQNYYSLMFKKFVNMTPLEYRKFNV